VRWIWSCQRGRRPTMTRARHAGVDRGLRPHAARSRTFSTLGRLVCGRAAAEPPRDALCDGWWFAAGKGNSRHAGVDRGLRPHAARSRTFSTLGRLVCGRAAAEPPRDALCDGLWFAAGEGNSRRAGVDRGLRPHAARSRTFSTLGRLVCGRAAAEPPRDALCDGLWFAAGKGNSRRAGVDGV
jgi:hypothetical protein